MRVQNFTSGAAAESVEVLQPASPVTTIGVGRAFAPPPSEPCVRFSRTRLSSRWFPHRGCLAPIRAVLCVNSPNLAKAALGPPLTPLPSADTMRSVPERRFDPLVVTGSPSRTSPSCLAIGNIEGRGASLQTSRIQLPASLPIGAVLLAAPLSVLQSNGIGAMKALTPAALTPRGGSLRLLRFAFPPFRAFRPGVAFSVVSAPSVIPGFAIIQQARHGYTPNQIRAPTDWRFASGCSPPRLAPTQLPSATWLRHSMTGTRTPQTKRPHRRTGCPGQARA